MKTPNEMIEALFAAGIVKGLSKKAAALAAGCPESTANHSATRLFRKPAVQAAIESARKELREKTVYDAAACIAEINDTIKFARSKGNSMAAIKGVALKAQICGLLVDTLDVRLTEKPSVRTALEEARARAPRMVNAPALSGPEPVSDIWGD
jgi:hypothetical protein